MRGRASGGNDDAPASYFLANRGAAAGGDFGGAGPAGGSACGTFFGFFASLLPR